MKIGQWITDLRYAGRALRKSPGFTFATVGTLALALGANAAIFSVVDKVLLEPLPYAELDRLVEIRASAPGSDFPDEFGIAREFFLEYRDQVDQLEDLAAYNSFTNTLRVGDRVARLRMSAPTLSLFSTLGATPILGRLPAPEEDGNAAVISHALWVTWFGSDPNVIGQSHEMMGDQRTIVGVMGPDFRFPSDGVVLWVPFEITRENLRLGRFGLNVVGRMSPDATHESLALRLNTVAGRLPEAYDIDASYAELLGLHVPVVRSIEESLLGDIKGAIWVLMGSVAVVLLIACANVANLFTVRGEARGRDLAIRHAMGAGRGRLLRSQLAEAMVIAALAGAVALPLAWITLPAFLRAAPQELPRLGDVSLSWSTAVFTLFASAFTAILCGLGPALQSSRVQLTRLRDGGRGSTTRRHWGRDGLVVVQTSLALVLLVGSGLLIRSFWELRNVDPGYNPKDVFTFQFAPQQPQLTDGPSWAQFHVNFMDRLRGLPGVEGVGIVENVPLDEGVGGVRVTAQGGEGIPDGSPLVSATFAGGDYFATMEIDVLEGRGFNDRDAVVPGSVVISRDVANVLWPDEPTAVGQRLRSSMSEEWHTVVGVVEEVVQYDLRNASDDPLIYYPLVGPTPTSWRRTSPGYVVRTNRAEVIAPEIRALVAEVAPRAPMYRAYTMEGLVDRSMVELSFTMMTLAIAAGLALLLGAIGLYGVLSYVVAQRTQEIGVRMALGAEASRVRRMVVAQGARVVGLGVLIGVGASLLATRLLGVLLFDVAPLDLGTFFGMSAVMMMVGLFASYLPARRASMVDPVQSMRGD